MKKKKIIVIGIMAILAVVVVGVVAVFQSPRWSEKSFEATVQEIVTRPDGEIRLIVERTTEIYGSPVNSLGISEDTKLLGKDGKELSIHGFQQGNAVTVTLKDAFTEEGFLIHRICQKNIKRHGNQDRKPQESWRCIITGATSWGYSRKARTTNRQAH